MPWTIPPAPSFVTQRCRNSSAPCFLARLRLTLPALLGLLALPAPLVIGACGPSPPPVCKGHVYALRGRVEAVSPPGGGPRLLTVHHESVDAFIDRQGKTVAMDAMTMPFPVSGRVPLAGVAAGDVVAMSLCVDWQADTEI